MNDILREHLDLTAVGILDDVAIFSEDPSLHVQHVRSILQILRDNLLGPLPLVTSAPIVSVPNPHYCASRLYYICAYSVCSGYPIMSPL